MPHRRLRILTWHVHGNYLYYLSQAPHDFFLVCDARRGPGYAGKVGRLPWGDNVHDAPADRIQQMDFDCVLFQSLQAYREDRQHLLSPQQQRLPQIYLEHDPPQEHPTNTRHPVDDGHTLLVHVTHFNALMWDNGTAPTAVVEHGVMVPANVEYDGRLARGIVVVNNLRKRGRRLGLDVFERARASVALDLVGMGALDAGGLGEIANIELPAFMARYRFFFHPIRYTSLGLALCEAMLCGIPIVGLATTELPTVIEDGRTGFIATDPARLIDSMRLLLADRGLAAEIGAAGRKYARERFGIERFVADWNRVFARVTG